MTGTTAATLHDADRVAARNLPRARRRKACCSATLLIGIGACPFFGLLVNQPSVAGSQPPVTQPASGDASGELDALVQAYFQERDPSERRKLEVQIEETAGGDVETVAPAVRRAALWEPRPGGRDDFDFATATGQSRTVETHVPDGYDSAQRYPLIVGLHWALGAGEGYLDYVLHLLGPARNDYVVAVPRGYRGFQFDDKPDEALEPVDFLRDLRRRYHVDTDRVYVVGYSKGGFAAFQLATFYTHWFAAAVSLSGTLLTPYPEQMRDILLPNLRHTPMLVVWGADDAGRGGTGPLPRGIAGANRELREVAERLKLPMRVIELEGVGHRGLLPPQEPFLEFLKPQRDPNAREVSHWFRYPVQGRAGWLSQLEFAGEPWTAANLAVLPAPDMDFDAYATRVLKEKLAYVGGRIEGQHIAIQTSNTDGVELRLHAGLLDLDQPVTIEWNGKTRLEARVQPKISTLLELAYDDWDFQNLTTVRLTIDDKGHAQQR